MHWISLNEALFNPSNASIMLTRAPLGQIRVVDNLEDKKALLSKYQPIFSRITPFSDDQIKQYCDLIKRVHYNNLEVHVVTFHQPKQIRLLWAGLFVKGQLLDPDRLPGTFDR